MIKWPSKKSLLDAYRCDGFKTEKIAKGKFGDQTALVLSLTRRSKKNRCWQCGLLHRGWYDRKIKMARDLSCGDRRVYLEFEIRRVRCRKTHLVRQEDLAWLANNPFYTKRFADFVGRKCRSMTIKDVAKELCLDWHTVKELEKEYMRKQLAKAPPPKPRVIGVDEISVKRGHEYRIIVSDLERRRPIWFGGTDRSHESMDLFYKELGPEKCAHIRLAVMDMWKAFRTSAHQNAPQA